MSDKSNPSKWWLIIAAQPPLTLFTAVSLFVINDSVVGSASGASTLIQSVFLPLQAVTILLSVPAVVGAFALAPAFPIALFLDARAIHTSDIGWNPNPYLYATLGLLQLAEPLAHIAPFPFHRFIAAALASAVAVYYLHHRYHYTDLLQ